jgi:hypothetical protein
MEVHTLEPADLLGFVNLVNLVNFFRALLSRLTRACARARVRVKEVHKVREVHKPHDFAHEFPCEPRVNLRPDDPEVHTRRVERVNLVNLFRDRLGRVGAPSAERAAGCRQR